MVQRAATKMENAVLDKLRRIVFLDPVKAKRAFASELKRLKGNATAQFEFAKEAAIIGVSDAINEVVRCYQEGVGTEPDRVKAFEWIRKAATIDRDVKFAFDLARCYRDGDGTERDVEKFWIWMKKAADTGDTEAMFQLAEACLEPKLGTPSSERAVEWTIKMAEKKEPGALVLLARMYDSGTSFKRDPDKFLKYAEAAHREALSQWKSRNKNRNWIYENLPEALVAHAEALSRNDRQPEERAHVRKAAQAAWDAFDLAQSKNASVGLRLPEIMLLLIPQLKGKNDRVPKRHESKYFDWLSKIQRAVTYIQDLKDDEVIPYLLVEAVYDLALAFKKGTGTPPKQMEYMTHLRWAANAGHGPAAYSCAMFHHEKGELAEFTQFISLAANANDMDAMIVQQLSELHLSPEQIDLARSSLQALSNAADGIRKSRHQINVDPNGRGIAHYTNADALTSMLSGTILDPKNGVWLSSIVYVNDPTEGRRLRDHVWKVPPDVGKNPLKELFAEIDHGQPISWLGQELHVFIACFSLEVDNLNLWRFYGADGKGCSIVSPASAFKAGSSEGMIRGPWAKRTKAVPELALYRVLYDDKAVDETLKTLASALKPVMEVAEELDCGQKLRFRSLAIAVISDLLYLYKDEQYAAEKEVRAAVARTLSDSEIKTFKPGNKQYSKLYLETGALLFQKAGSEIIVGPKAEEREAVILDLQHRLASQKWAGMCKVSGSETSYR